MNIFKKIFGTKVHACVIHIGDIVEFSCVSHASVGFTSDIKYDRYFFDCNISTTVPDNCDPGGDVGTKYYTLKALKKGKTSIEIIEYFRSAIEKQTQYHYNIKS